MKIGAAFKMPRRHSRVMVVVVVLVVLSKVVRSCIPPAAVLLHSPTGLHFYLWQRSSPASQVESSKPLAGGGARRAPAA